MEDFLKAIEDSIKRLVTPVSVLIAAAFLLNGVDKPNSSNTLIYILFGLLCIWAFAFTLISAKVTINKIYAVTENKVFALIICLSFMPVYLILITAAIKFGFDKVT